MSENNYEFPYKVLTFLGLWNLESGTRRIRRLYVLLQSFALFSLLVIMNLCFWDLYFVRKDLHKASTNLSATLSVFMVFWKNMQALRNYRKIRGLQEDLTRGLYKREDCLDRMIVEKAQTTIKRHYKVVYFTGAFTMSMWMLSGIVQKSPDGKKVLPVPFWIPWDYQASPYYELALLFQAYAGYFVTCDILTVNLTILGTIMQICTEYHILRKNTLKIKEWNELRNGPLMGVRILSEEENREARAMMAEIVIHHQRIIRSVNRAEDCYVDMMLVQFLGCALLITVVILDLILISDEVNSRLITLAIFLSSVAADIFLYCFMGTLLTINGQKYLENLYELPWEVMNSKNRKFLSIMIMKAQKPPRLTVSKFANIDFYSLLQLTKIVYNVLYLLLHFARDK